MEPLDWDDALAMWTDADDGGELDDNGAGEGWVTVAEAERRAGVSRSALRAWYRSSQVPSRLVDGPYGPQRLLPLGPVIERAQRSPRVRRRAAQGVGLEAELTLLRQRVDELERRLGEVERRSPPS